MQIISTMTPQGAAEYLRARGMSISPDTLRRGIEQGVYPFGLCIKTDGSAVYQIFKRLLTSGSRKGALRHEQRNAGGGRL